MKKTNATKTIFVIEVDVSAEEWSLGHLPRFHALYVAKFLELGHRVFSISPDKKYVMQRVSPSFTSQLICFEHHQLLHVNQEVQTENNFIKSYKTTKYNPKLVIKKYLGILLPPFLNEWLKSFWQKLRKNSFYHRRYCKFEFQKYQKYLDAILSEYNLKKENILVFFPYLDNFFSGYLNFVTFDGILKYEWSGLLISTQSFNKKNSSSLNQSINFKGFGTLEEDKLTQMQNALQQKKIIAFPDLAMPVIPNADYPLVRQIKWEARDRKIVGLFGFSTERKGALNFLVSSFLAAEKKLNNCFFVLAGGCIFSKLDILNYLNRSSHETNSLTYLSAIKNDEDFVAVLNVCDIIYAAYMNFPGSSNILAYAAFLKKPVIVSEGFLMAKRVKEYGIGLAIPQNDPEKCLEAIECLLRGSDFNGNPLKFDFVGYTQKHSYENLGKAIECLVNSNL